MASFFQTTEGKAALAAFEASMVTASEELASQHSLHVKAIATSGIQAFMINLVQATGG